MELKVEKRQAWKSKSLLKEWKVPWIVYSKHMQEPLMVKFNRNEFLKLYEQAGSNQVITLKWDWVDQMSLIYDWQLDPVKDAVIHVDFLAVRKWQKVKADVPVVIEWEEALQKAWFQANLVIYELEVEATPSKLPQDIKVDVSELKEWDNIHIWDLKIDKEVELISDPEQVLLTIYDPEEEARKAEEREAAREAEIAAQTEEDSDAEEAWDDWVEKNEESDKKE